MGHKCCSKQKVKRGLWSPEEDEKLIHHITTYGHGSWSSVPKFSGLQRCGKSCRLRWINYLRPDLKKGSFSEQEERIIIDVHRILGNRWAQIAKHLPGRTDNEVKNFWNSCIKKKLIAQGLDPNTHNLLTMSTKPRRSNIINSCPNKATSIFSLDHPKRRANSNPNNIISSHFVHISNPNNDVFHDASSSIFSSCKYQNPNTVFPLQEALQNPSSLPLNSNDLENLFESMEFRKGTSKQEEMRVAEKASDEIVVNGLELDDTLESFNFDLDFVDSAILPCGLAYCHLGPVDYSAWNC